MIRGRNSCKIRNASHTLIGCEYFVHITSWQAYLWNGEWSTFGTKHIKGRGEKKTAQFKFVGKLWLDSSSKTAISNIRCNPAHPTKMALVFLGHKQPQSVSKGMRKNMWAMLKAPALLRGLAGHLESVVSPSPSHFLLTPGTSENRTQEGGQAGRC